VKVSHEIMRMRSVRTRRHSKRSSIGSNIPDFAAAMVILVLVVFIPLLDLTILPIRWMLAREIINEYSRRLALCETFSKAYKTMQADPSLATRLLRLGGVESKDISLRLRISRVFITPRTDEHLFVYAPGRIPPAWLPGGEKSPCTYTLELTVDTLISPAILFSSKGVSVPGLTGPVPFRIGASHEWENLGRNPGTRAFYLNE